MRYCIALLLDAALLLHLVAFAACQPAGDSAARGVQDAASLRRALQAGQRHISIAARSINATALPVFRPESPEAHVFPVAKPTATVTGVVTRGVRPVILLEIEAGLFLVSKDTRLWLDSLTILFKRTNFNNVAPVAVLRVGDRARVWITNLQADVVFDTAPVDTPAQAPTTYHYYYHDYEPDATYYGYDYDDLYQEVWDEYGWTVPVIASTYLAATREDARLYVADSEIRLHGSLALSARSTSTVAFVNTHFTVHGRYPTYTFEVDCVADRLRLLNSTISLACSSKPMVAATSYEHCTFPNPGRYPESFFGWDVIMYSQDMEALEFSEAGDSICSVLDDNFLTGEEPEFLELVDQVAAQRPERRDPRTCVTVLTNSSTPCYIDQRLVGYHRDTSTHDNAHILVALVPACVMGIVALVLYIRSRNDGRGAQHQEGPAEGIGLFPSLMHPPAPTVSGAAAGQALASFRRDLQDSGETEAYAFTPPLADPGCNCVRRAAGDTACLLCPLCATPYTGSSANDGDRRPKALPCGHSVCAACASTPGTLREYLGTADNADVDGHLLPINYPATDMLSGMHRAPAPAGCRHSRAQSRASTEGGTARAPEPTAAGETATQSGSAAAAHWRYAVDAVQKSGRSILSLASSLAWSSSDLDSSQRSQRWRPNGDACMCPICFNPFSTSPPQDTAAEPGNPLEGSEGDRRPVIFPCGHGACADCASRIRQRKLCYERCHWQPQQLEAPFPVNHLMLDAMRLTAGADGSVRLPRPAADQRGSRSGRLWWRATEMTQPGAAESSGAATA